MISKPTITTISASSRCIPSDKDFHFYRNFGEFKVPIADIARESQLIFKAIGASHPGKFGVGRWQRRSLPNDAYNWLMNVNDNILEQFDVMADEFERVRQKEEKIGCTKSSAAFTEDSNDRFQLVCGNNKRVFLG
ncbi:hypothetical protein PIB30_067151 [Stylosanthes scabra]|uniref:Uncharacterized protein n=1 Tax=Stylosanthes scabra TaxID=79078 RepID=A0ABU6ZL81_9FABA|nr:hypothetical protein [Stylosanthes scabra]